MLIVNLTCFSTEQKSNH